ncbi:hypothetical protein HY637_01395 [Candidatus Woesearchaeota archaeon]|nr:hypothetical protein [Candidatus Woesearchaeota archaeon]
MPEYIFPGDIVINAMPTRFSNPSIHEERDASVSNDLAALSKGAHVVAAHKSAFGAQHIYQEVVDCAALNNAVYVPAGAVMGPTRVAEVLSWLKQNNVAVAAAQGVVNGTSNFMLSRMFFDEKNFDAALNEAVRLGYADGDGRDDIQGRDALSKMKAVALIQGKYSHSGGQLYGLLDDKSDLPSQYRRMVEWNSPLGIEGITVELLQELKRDGKTVRLVGAYDNTTGSVLVGPVVLPLDHPFAGLRGTENMMILYLDGEVQMADLLQEVYRKSTPIQRDDGNFMDYLVQNEYNVATPGGGKKAGFDVHLRYDPTTNQLIIQGPGAGSPETAHALLEAADSIKLKIIQNRIRKSNTDFVYLR